MTRDRPDVPTSSAKPAVAEAIGLLPDTLRPAWHHFLDAVAPIRPDLHAYCRRLTGHLWDAEDLVQDTLIRGFGRLGQRDHPVDNPRAYLLRIATHLWIDHLRRRGTERRLADDPAPAAAPGPEADQELREAGETLLARLAPRERAAVALKEGFDLSLAEVAEILGTSVGAVKAALHRGRGRLEALGDSPTPTPAAASPSPELLERFIRLFRAGDAAGLAALLEHHASVELVGCNYQEGPEHGWFGGLVHGHPEWPEEWHFQAQRLDAAEVLGERVLLVFRTRRNREKLEQVVRVEAQDGRITRLRDYGFCPEVTRAVGGMLGLPVRTGPYRYPTPAPGESWVPGR